MENELIEIWNEHPKGEILDYKTNKSYTLVAILINGVPIKLNDGFIMEKRNITEFEKNKLFNK